MFQIVPVFRALHFDSFFECADKFKCSQHNNQKNKNISFYFDQRCKQASYERQMRSSVIREEDVKGGDATLISMLTTKKTIKKQALQVNLSNKGWIFESYAIYELKISKSGKHENLNNKEGF